MPRRCGILKNVGGRTACIRLASISAFSAYSAFQIETQSTQRTQRNVTNYAAPIQDLLREDRLPPLGPGSPVRSFHAALAQPIERLFAPAKILASDFAAGCHAALWLHFDYLDESHKISQDLDTVEGSYWHGMMHRREPDFGNAKYWFRRLGQHPIFEPLCKAAAELTHAAGMPQPAAFLAKQSTWDPMAFVDLCEAASQGKADEMLCRRIQQCEWHLLFDYCYDRAVGRR